MMKPRRHVGQPLLRKEDRRLLTGAGVFIADVKLPRALAIAFARSPYAHARIVSVDLSRAKALPGVVAVLTGNDLAGDLKPVPGMQNQPPPAWKAAVEHRFDVPSQPLLAVDKIRYVGEPYAVVVAESRYIAEDAAELIDIEVEELPVVDTIEAATGDDAPEVHEGHSRNTVAEFRIRKGDVDGPALTGMRRIRRRFRNHRFLAAPMECRGVVAQYDPRQDSLTIWSSTQVVHWVRREVARQLGLPEARVRCVAPDVGGGFGVKGHVYPEEIIAAYLARRLRRPVEWIEDRQEHLLNSSHSRDDEHDAEIIFDDDGVIHGLKDWFTKDSGAYVPVGLGAPSNTATHICGPYAIPNLDLAARVVVTNKAPNAPYRGSGRPEAVLVMERLIELIASELGLEPAEVRRRNMIPPENMPFAVGVPYRDGIPVVYDSGDFPGSLQRALKALGGLDEIRAEQQQARSEGRFIGLGIACYVEGTGAGPFEGATVRIDPTGAVYVATGACSQGQSHETVFAQVAADEWGVDPDDVTVVQQDTAAISLGYGTIASRSAVNSSAAIRAACAVLRRKVLALAAHLLECDASDLELRDGRVSLAGVPQRGLSLAEIARAAQPHFDNPRPEGMPGGLEVTEYFEPRTVTWSYGTHAAIIELDPHTGDIHFRKYVVAHDAGVILNPMAANGQILGGICQGLGGCLLERVVYQEGQNITTSLLDYPMPSAALMPDVEIHHVEIPSPLNELGVKGLGEGGAVAPPALVANAVCDALRPIGFEICDSFIDQEEIVRALNTIRHKHPT